MLTISSSLFQTAPIYSNMLQPTNRSLQMLRVNRPLVGQANTASMPQMVIPDEQFRKAMGGMTRTTLEQRREIATADGPLPEELTLLPALEDDPETTDDEAVYTQIFVRNLSDIEIEIAGHQDWFGAPKTTPLQKTIRAKGDANFLHVADLTEPQGSKGGLLCFGKTKNRELAWLISWHAPQNGKNKVYAKYGKRIEVEKGFDWDEVKNDLDKATATDVPYRGRSGAYYLASIEPDGNRPTLLVTIGVYFL